MHDVCAQRTRIGYFLRHRVNFAVRVRLEIVHREIPRISAPQLRASRILPFRYRYRHGSCRGEARLCTFGMRWRIHWTEIKYGTTQVRVPPLSVDTQRQNRISVRYTSRTCIGTPSNDVLRKPPGYLNPFRGPDSSSVNKNKKKIRIFIRSLRINHRKRTSMILYFVFFYFVPKTRKNQRINVYVLNEVTCLK